MGNFDDFAKELQDEPLAETVQQQHLQYLRSLPVPPSRPAKPAPPRRLGSRRGWSVAALVTGALVVAGGGTAAAIAMFSPATDTATGYCYARANLDESATNRVEYAAAGTPDRPGDASSVALDVCAAYWRSGVFNGGVVDSQRPPAGGDDAVPDLVACVLPDGKVGVFPGDPAICHRLGLSQLAP